MLKVAITGGIGSGKTRICKAFEWCSAPIFNTDLEVKHLYSDLKVKNVVINLLGKESYKNCYPDFKYISSKIFSDSKLKNQLTSQILYPKLFEKLEDWYRQHKNKPYVLVESALIFEAEIENKFDKIILVYADLEERIKRAMLRDKASREDVISRIKNNIPEEQKIKLCDYVIINQHGYDTYDQIVKIHVDLLESQ